MGGAVAFTEERPEEDLKAPSGHHPRGMMLSEALQGHLLLRKALRDPGVYPHNNPVLVTLWNCWRGRS